MNHDDLAASIADIVSNVTKRPVEELVAQRDASFSADFGMTSIQMFPLISEIEERFGVDTDYAEFLNDAVSINTTATYVGKLLGA